MIELTDFQWDKLDSASRGFCYDANPSTWPDKAERKEMEALVECGLM